MSKWSDTIRAYGPAGLAASTVFALLAGAGISGCMGPLGSTSPYTSTPTPIPFFVSHELPDNSGDPIWRGIAITVADGLFVTAQAVPIPSLVGLKVRALGVFDTSDPNPAGELNGSRLYALVTSSALTGNSLSVVLLPPSGSATPLATIPIAGTAQAMVLSKSSRLAYVVTASGNTIYRVDLLTFLTDIFHPVDGSNNPAFQTATDIAVRQAPTGDQILVADKSTGSITVLNQDLSFHSQLQIDSGAAIHMAVSPDQQNVYATTGNTSTKLWAFSGAAIDSNDPNPVAAAVDVSSASAVLATKGHQVQVISDNGTALELQNYDLDSLTPASSKQVLRTFARPNASGLYLGDEGPAASAPIKDVPPGPVTLVADSAAGQVSIADSATKDVGTNPLALSGTIDTLNLPVGVTASYTTTGLFLCQPPLAPGTSCGTNTASSGGVQYTYRPVPATVRVPQSGSVNVTLGTLEVTCVGGGTACATAPAPQGMKLNIQISQTAPVNSSGGFLGSVAGNVSGTASTLAIAWLPSSIKLPPSGGVTYTLLSNPLAVNAPAGGPTVIQCTLQ